MESTFPPNSSAKALTGNPQNITAKASVLSQSRRTIDEHTFRQVDQEKIAQAITMILEAVGEDPKRDGLLDTPLRVGRMYQELLYGIDVDAASEISCEFICENDELVLVRDIQFASLCEHHLVPFIGMAHVGYIPSAGRITGLSKLARVVELVSKRLQVQERMTTQIADAINRQLQPRGVIVVLEAEHLCMSIRGVKKPGSRTITSAVRGLFETNQSSRSEVMSLILK